MITINTIVLWLEWLELILLLVLEYIKISLILDFILLPLWIHIFISTGVVTSITLLLLPRILAFVVLVAICTISFIMP